MRVLFDLSPSAITVGGTSIYALNLYKKLKELDGDTEVIAHADPLLAIRKNFGQGTYYGIFILHNMLTLLFQL